MNTREVVEDYFKYINDGDWANWLSLFSEETIFDDAVSGRLQGLKAMQECADGMVREFAFFTNTIQEIVVEGEKCMVVCNIKAKTKSGKELESPGANFYHVVDGKIVYMSSYHDPRPFHEAFS